MDRSVDSIGSCSLDVDAESTDFSDTSGSFNLLTPSSAKDFPREFITRIHERSQCPPPQFRQQTSIVLDPQSGKINTILQPPPKIVEESLSAEEPKKPSYLNLACCVNGYSNLTTYDSKVRQNINKSREVSPIRPITYASLQSYAKVDFSGVKNLFVPPQVAMFRQSGDSIESHKSVMSPEKRLFTQHMMATDTNGVGQDTTDNVRHFRTTKYIHTMSSTTTTKKIVDDVEVQQQQHKTGSIAQHVERLFGPGALAQGFHTNRRSGENGQTTAVLTEKSMNSRNFFSPVVKMTRKEAIANGGAHEKNGSTKNGDGMENLKEMEVTLPVLRHLRPEFREQLPICASPRRYVPPTRENHSSPQIANGTHYPMETNHLIETPTNDIQVNKTEEMQQHEFGEKIGDAHALVIEEAGVTKDKIKDGNYFLDIMGKERGRILSLADKIDGYMEQVKAKEDTEEIIGYIRAASGKARLLAAQKMKQFEGLCQSNLNQKPGEKFQTTGEDLQGFWDMVMLQVNHVDSLFDEIETLKVNNWKKKPIETPVPPQGVKLTRKPVATKGNSSTASNQSQASSKKSAAAALAAQKREAQRKQFMELKRKQRTAMNQAQNEDTTNGTRANNVDQA